MPRLLLTPSLSSLAGVCAGAELGNIRVLYWQSKIICGLKSSWDCLFTINQVEVIDNNH